MSDQLPLDIPAGPIELARPVTFGRWRLLVTGGHVVDVIAADMSSDTRRWVLAELDRRLGRDKERSIEGTVQLHELVAELDTARWLAEP